nr:MAG TPA: hypothetical protein [Caudoviricetes sp.]
MPPAIHDGRPLHHYEGGADKGHPSHEHHRHTHHPHTTHPTENSARHDNSTDEYCTGKSRTRAGLHALDGPTAHTTAIPHTTHERMDTIHPPTLTLFTFTQPTNDHDQQ